jgi:chromosome segregation ATPase
MSPSLSRQPSPEEERIAELDAENAELRKQNDILTTARQLEEAERERAQRFRDYADSADRQCVAEVQRREQAEAELALSREQTEYANDAMMAMCGRAEQAEAALAASNERFASLARRITTFLVVDSNAREQLLGGLNIELERAERGKP